MTEEEYSCSEQPDVTGGGIILCPCPYAAAD
jgi:hypothetical protein